MTEPDEFDEFRRHQERQERSRLIAVRILDFLTVLAFVAIGVLVLKMILY